MNTAGAAPEGASIGRDPETRVRETVDAHVSRSLAWACLLLGVACCSLLVVNVGQWLAGGELRQEAIPAPSLLLPFCALGSILARRGRLAGAALYGFYLVGCTIPTLAMLINSRSDPMEAREAIDITIWLWPFCITATVLTLDRALSHWTALLGAAQYAGIHALALSVQGEPSLGSVREIELVDGVIRVAALLVIGVVAGQANHSARATIVALVEEEERTRVALLARVRAEERGRAASAFLARMSHELKTPLNVILGSAQFLQLRGHLEGAGREQIEAVLLSGRHLLSLVEDLLDQGRISSGGELVIRPQRVELDLLASELEQMLREQADRRGLALRIEREPAAPALMHVDPQRLRQILLNLLVNALKFTEQGEVTLRIRAISRPDEVVFEVRDSGHGIPAQALERIFEPFAQLDPSTDGTGLGLSIARALARAMGGELEVESTIGSGSCFRLTLPAGAAPGPLAEARGPARSPLERGGSAPAELELVRIPEAVRTRLRQWAERGNMSKLRQAALEVAAEDPALAPLCKALCACADDFDDARALQLLEGSTAARPSSGSTGP